MESKHGCLAMSASRNNSRMCFMMMASCRPRASSSSFANPDTVISFAEPPLFLPSTIAASLSVSPKRIAFARARVNNLELVDAGTLRTLLRATMMASAKESTFSLSLDCTASTSGVADSNFEATLV